MYSIKLIQEVYYLPSGRVFVGQTKDNYKIEFTEMRDVAVDGKLHKEVREETEASKIWPHLVPYEEKWLLTVSTQKGCAFNCKFCDVAPLKFEGNLKRSEILDQVRLILRCSPYVQSCKKVKIGFARMGEPALNLYNVLDSMVALPDISKEEERDFKWLPCFNSILPRKCGNGIDGFKVIFEVISVKESVFDGFLHFQISCNSTDENVRKQLFGGADVLTLKEIIDYINRFEITNRTVTLNFIVMKGIPVDVKYLVNLGLNPEKFVVKLIPLNKTTNAQKHNLETYANYSNYEDLVRLANKFQEQGIPVIYDAIARCEEAGLCCGQLVGAKNV